MKISDSRCGRRNKPPTLILLAAFAAMLPTALTAATVDRTAITVRVYQTAGISSDVERRALAEAKAVLAAARVDVSWLTCTSEHAETCKTVLGPSELLVQMIRTGAPLSTLGAAHVDQTGGALATVYVNHVARLAKEAGTDPAVLLGRVTAHELGHLLMGARHSHFGLMRPNWTPAEVRQNRSFDWRFTTRDLAAMRSQGRNVRD